MPGTAFTAASTSAPIRSISPRLAPKTLMPIGVRMPVESMSIRALIGIVHAFVVPGIFSARSISSTSSSCEMWSRHTWRRTPASHPGAQDEYQRSFFRHSDSGFRRTVVSIIENGAGSVEVSARPALPNTRSTSGKDFRTRSCTCSSRSASVTEMPGSVVGM